MPKTPTPPPAEIREFPEHFRDTVQGLRSSLIELLSSVAADPTQPQDLARRFGLNKNLTWKVSKIVAAADEYAAAPHVPGTNGIGILLKALGKAGAPPDRLQRVRDALDAYEEMVALHTGDRATLELLTAGMSRDPGRAERLEQARRQAYMGCGGTWGVQAELRLATAILAPSATTPDKLDYMSVGGLYGFRRLRPDVGWTLFRRYASHDDGSGVGELQSEPVDPDAAQDGLDLIGAFCSERIPTLDVVKTPTEILHVLPSGPVGNTARFDCVYGTIFREVLTGVRTPTDRLAELAVTLVTPVARVQFDLVVHEDLDWLTKVEPALYSRLDGSSVAADTDRDRHKLPMLEEIQHLGRGIGNMASPHVPRYTDLLRTAVEAAGWDGDRFHGFRLSMRYPPIPTTLLMMAELPEA
ncbi:MAG: hypothetical protein ACYTCU_05465 [Planctomycetota bacterium]|jgi:hypothetical protein